MMNSYCHLTLTIITGLFTESGQLSPQSGTIADNFVINVHF
jgi:hypothetical protein